MGAYVVRRIIAAIPTIFIVSIVVFVLMRLAPGTVVDAILGESSSVSESQRAELEHEFGLDDPLPVQYWSWLRGLVTGDLGTSFYTKEPVVDTLQRTSVVTLQLALLAISVSLVVGIAIGSISALSRGRPMDAVFRVIMVAGLSAPEFWLSVMAITYLAILFEWVPPQGRYVFVSDPGDTISQLAIPAAILGYRLSAVVGRMTRSAALEVLSEDYVRTARAKGLNGRSIWVRHVLPNALLPVVTILGAQSVVLIGGAVIVEQVFSLPGMGRLLLQTIVFRDYPVVQTTVFLLAIAVVAINLIVDLSYGWLDPRIRGGA